MPTNLPSTSGIIPYDVPTPGGDVDLWDTGLNASPLTQISQDIYGLRENSYLSIRGGGKISWNSSNQVSWTEDIVIRDHVTSNTTTIQASGSPVTLSAQNTVAYIAKVREPASNQTPTFTTVAAGSLTKAIGNNNFLVLFMRTGDDTLYVPWLQRELLVSDHWQFGSVLSWYERLASRSKPSVLNDTDAATNFDIPASINTPSVVFIDGKIYSNIADRNLDMTVSGRNGLDTGAIAANTPYYVYAIPPVSGRGFDVVASVTGPETGPTGFSSWSYIIATATQSGAATFKIFQASQGKVQFAHEIESESDGSGSIVLKLYASLPTTAKLAYFQCVATGTSIDVGVFISSSSALQDALTVAVVVSGDTNYAWGYVPIITSQTVWLQSNNASNTIIGELYGWVEDPMEFQ